MLAKCVHHSHLGYAICVLSGNHLNKNNKNKKSRNIFEWNLYLGDD